MANVTQDQFRVLVKAMKAVFPDPKFIPDQDAFMTWYMMLNDLTYEQLSEAVKAYMQTVPYTPTIAGIRQKVVDMQPEGLTPHEAWGLVRYAVSRSGYYYAEEFAKLPKEVQKAVGSAENLRDWSQIETGTLDTVIYSQFLKSYQAVQNRRTFMSQLSEQARDRLMQNTLNRLEEMRGKNEERITGIGEGTEQGNGQTACDHVQLYSDCPVERVRMEEAAYHA